MQNKLDNDCESLWGTGLAKPNFLAATVRLYGDQDKARRIRQL
jgi:hypothetical protein